MTRVRRERYGEMVVGYGAALIALCFFLLPVWWMVSTSLKTPVESFAMPPKLFFMPTLENYRSVLFGTPVRVPGQGEIAGTDVQFVRAIVNSAIVSLVSLVLALLIGTPAAYALSRYRFRGKRDVALFILSTRMAPPLGVLIPFYILFSRARPLDTHLALIVMYTMMNLSIVVWMMSGFFRELPRELEEAARVDGASTLTTLRTITLPLSAPGLAATAILGLLFSWNEFLWAATLTSNAARTAPVSVLGFMNFREIVWGNLTAAGTLITLPPLIFALAAQRNLVRGLTMGAVRG